MTETKEPVEIVPARGRRPVRILGPLDVARLGWRRLRRMSTALALLFALASATVVGTIVPQEPVIAETVAEWRAGVDAAGDPVGPGRAVAAVFDTLGFFDVFGSWWFLTLVTLLFVSLTGCLLPRWRAFARVARRPPAAGRNLERLAAHEVMPTDLAPDEALARAEALLRRRHYRRRRVRGAGADGIDQVAAERGHLREGGSLIFHTAFYVLLTGVVLGQAFAFTGQVNLVEGASFVDTRLSYEGVNAGRLFGLGDHRAFRATLDEFTVTWHPNGVEDDFVSQLTFERDGDREQQTLRVNHPGRYDGMNLYQLRWGMAPQLVIRPAGGGEPFWERHVLMGAGPGWTWNGVERVFAGGTWEGPDGGERRELPQMALDIVLVPDVGEQDGQLVSRSPDARNPVLLANLYFGDLGLERNVPASALVGDWQPTQLADQVALRPGQPAPILGGAFEIELVGVRQWSGFQVSHQPARPLLLVGAGLTLLGLVPSLYAYRRRIWVTARSSGTGTEVVLAGTALQRRDAFTEEFAGIATELRRALPTGRPAPEETGSS